MKLSLILYAVSWLLVITEPSLWPVPLLGFAQNLAHTFVSRGRNSGSLGYHVVASVFSNGIYIALLVLSISIVGYMAASGIPVFIAVYVLSTMSGSVTAHALAMRLESGRARNVQEDRVAAIEVEVRALKAAAGLPVNVDDSGLCTYALVGRCSCRADVDSLRQSVTDRTEEIERRRAIYDGTMKHVHELNGVVGRQIEIQCDAKAERDELRDQLSQLLGVAEKVERLCKAAYRASVMRNNLSLQVAKLEGVTEGQKIVNDELSSTLLETTEVVAKTSEVVATLRSEMDQVWVGRGRSSAN